MTVVDASVVIDALATVAATSRAARRWLGDASEIEAPAILRAEVAAGVRRMFLAGALSEAQARATLVRTDELRVAEFPFKPFSQRIWQLRDVLTVYDAWYVALAETLDTPLVTADRRLAAAPGIRCPVEVVAPSGA